MPRVEHQPRLNPDQLPADQRIPKDRLLRGASAVEIVGAATGWLRDIYPTSKPAKYRIAATPAQLERESKRWAKQMDRDATEVLDDLTDVAAAHYRGELLVLPSTLKQLQGSMIERAVGFRTLAHEWWHLRRTEQRSFRLFEEGSAELFAERVLVQATGMSVDAARALRIAQYLELTTTVERLSDRLGGVEWLEASRRQNDVAGWFALSLAEAGFDGEQVAQLLRSRTPTELATRAKLLLGG